MTTAKTDCHDAGERRWAVAAHLCPLLGLLALGPLIIMIAKPLRSAFVNHHARQALLFQLFAMLGVCLMICTVFGAIFFPILAAGYLGGAILGALRANEGKWYRYPGFGEIGTTP